MGRFGLTVVVVACEVVVAVDVVAVEVGASLVVVVVVVVGAWLVVDAGVLVSDWADDVGFEDGSWLVVVSADVGSDGAAVVLILGDGLVGALSEVCRSESMIPAPIASTASAVPTATINGRRYQGPVPAPMTSGSAASSARGRATVRPVGRGSSSYSPARSGMMPESSSASDQASAGAASDSTGRADMIVASPTDPRAVGASAVSPSADPRDACNAAPTAAVNWGRGAEMTNAPDCSDSVLVTSGMLAPPPTDATAAKSPGLIPFCPNTL